MHFRVCPLLVERFVYCVLVSYQKIDPRQKKERTMYANMCHFRAAPSTKSIIVPVETWGAVEERRVIRNVVVDGWDREETSDV